jgi:hypothetical protein
MSEELKSACFEVARTTKWAQKPVDAADITGLADRFYKIAKEQEWPDLEIDLPLITRAVRYLGQVHAMPPMDDKTGWFYEMLRAVLEIARPNTMVAENNKAFLRDLQRGIEMSLSYEAVAD